MKTPRIIILPWYIKYVGGAIAIISFINATLQLLSETQITTFFDPNADIKVFAVYAMLILGLVLIVFSKEKIDDEYVNYIRLKSFLISVALHSLFFLILSFTNFTLSLINFPAIILMDSILLIYILAFYLQKFVRLQSNKDEK